MCTECLLLYKDILPDDCLSMLKVVLLCTSHYYASVITDTKQVRLVNIIGQGSFGTVYRAVWRGSIVAAKVIQVGAESSRVLSEVERCKYKTNTSSVKQYL